MIIAGPLESSRLGRTVAIQNVPCRQCTYSCLYCGLGGTERLRTRRRPFHTAEGVVDAVLRVLDRAPERVAIDHLSFQAGGEPTLDTHLGVEIRGLREAAIPIAVLTNASLLWRGDVRDELLAADLVSLKLDTADAETWRRLNRPGRQLRLGRILGGVAGFAESFGGLLHTETTLVPGV
ncbi:MAG: radical SAM protein, partial [Gemmatimonadota bacterium]